MIPDSTVRAENFDGEYNNLLEEIEQIPMTGTQRDNLVSHVYRLRSFFKDLNKLAKDL